MSGRSLPHFLFCCSVTSVMVGLMGGEPKQRERLVWCVSLCVLQWSVARGAWSDGTPGQDGVRPVA